jgi:hypothetical protein
LPAYYIRINKGVYSTGGGLLPWRHAATNTVLTTLTHIISLAGRPLMPAVSARVNRSGLPKFRLKKRMRRYAPEGRDFHNRNANGLRQVTLLLALPERQDLYEVLLFGQAFEYSIAFRKLRLRFVCCYKNLSFQDCWLNKIVPQSVFHPRVITVDIIFIKIYNPLKKRMPMVFEKEQLMFPATCRCVAVRVRRKNLTT